MFRSRSFCLIHVFATACIAAAVFAGQAFVSAWGSVRIACGYVGECMAFAFKEAASHVLIARPLVAFVQARSFVMAYAKRERPVVTARWRMCPSA